MAGPQHTSFHYDVFLSHSSADKPVVRELAVRLQDAGLRVWFDEWIIKPGDLISAKIEEGLEHSGVLLFCMSAQAFGSEWVGLESHSAIFRDPQNLERRFVPLRLDDAPIKAMLQGYAYIDWRPGTDRREQQWTRLLEACGVTERGLGGGGMGKTTTGKIDTNTAVPGSSKVQESGSPSAIKPRMANIITGDLEFPDSTQHPLELNLYHPNLINSVGWCPDGVRVASGGNDGAIWLWDAGNAVRIAVLEGHKAWVRSVGWSPDGAHVVSGGDDGTVRLWDSRIGKQMTVLEGHNGGVTSADWSPDGARVASGGYDGSIRLWDAIRGTLIGIIAGHKRPVNSLKWSPDGTRLASGGNDGNVRLWNIETGTQLALLNGHKAWVRSVDWAPAGTKLASGSNDGTIRLWDAASGLLLAILEGHWRPVNSVSWGPDGSKLLSGSNDGTVRPWDIAKCTELAILKGHKAWVSSVCWNPEGTRLVSGGNDRTIRIWDTSSGNQLALLEGHNAWVRSVGWSTDGAKVASGGDDRAVRLWDSARGSQLAMLEGHKDWVRSVSFSPNGAQLVSGGDDQTVRLWDAVTGSLLALMEAHRMPVTSVRWSPDGSIVASGSNDRTVRLWDAVNGTQLAILAGHRMPVNSVSWSPDATKVVSGGDDRMVYIWDVSRRSLDSVLSGHWGPVNCVDWSPDGLQVISGGDDGTVRLWDAARTIQLAVLEGHWGPVKSVGWSPDGARLVSGGDDGTVRLWDAKSCTQLALLKGHKNGVISVGWSPDGRVWAADGFGLVLFWPFDPQTPPTLPANPDASRVYTNAKVLVVGESGAGKTGLTHRLATGSFQPSASTIGAWCTHLPLPQPTSPETVQPQREVWLWDFGGQADQRLIHQLFLDRAALVLLLFDASRDEVLEGLHEWQTALRRSLPDPPPQLLVAARVDAGFRADRVRLETFAKEEQLTILETSARDGSGCEALQQAIHDAIAWDKLPRHTSPRLFQEIKSEILRLRDQGKALLTLKDLRELLRPRVHTPGFDDPSLLTVLGLLDGPGVLKQLDYGTYVLLKPEWVGVYGQAVLRRLRQAEPQLGALPVGAIAAAALPFADDQPRLEPAEEQALLAELERQLQDRKICLRQGGQLVFPSHCGRERPPSPALPPRFVSYAVRGWLDEIHATLVVSLAETRVFCLQNLWRDAAEFLTLTTTPTLASGQALAVQLRRENAREGLITLHVGPEVADAERVQFALFIDNHLRATAETVARRRHWICPHCKAPKGNEEVLMKKLARAGERANVMCDDCDRRFPLYDNLERLFTDTSLRRQAEALGELELPELTARRKGKLLLLEVGARITSANQKWQEITPDEDDGLDLQLEFTDDDGNGTGAYLYLQLKAGPSHLHRRADGRDIFSIKKPRWVRTWTQQPFPVMLVIGRPAGPEGWDFDGESLADGGFDDGWPARKRVLGPASLRRWNENNRERFPSPRTDHRAFPDVRWMEISSLLKQELAAGRSPEDIRHIDFEGEPLDLASVLRWRRKILDGRPL